MSVPTEESAHIRGGAPPASVHWPTIESGPPARGAPFVTGTTAGIIRARSEGVVLLDEHGRVLTVNRRAEVIFGYGRSDLLGRSVDRLFEHGSAELFAAGNGTTAWPRTLAGLTGRRRDGSGVTLDVRLTPLLSEHGRRVVAVLRPGVTAGPSDGEGTLAQTDGSAEAHDILQLLPDAVWVLGAATGCLTYANRRLSSLLGYAPEALVGRPLGDIAPTLSDGAFLRIVNRLGSDGGRSIAHGSVLRRIDGVDITAEIRIYSLPGEQGGHHPPSYVFVATDPSEDAEGRAGQRRLDLEIGIAADRERIAQDLHDGVIQRIFATAMSVQSLRARLRPAFDADAARIVDELDRSIAEIRTVIFQLQPPEGDAGGLQADLLKVLEEERAALGFSPTVRMSGDLPNGGREWSHHLCAIVRELLSNIARHAHASEAEMDLQAGDLVVLRISDDGVGFDPALPRRGRGVRNMTQRASVLGGSLLIHQRPGGGTTVECILPRPEEAA